SIADPLRAPHGCFRQIGDQNLRHAVDFLAAFGPLELGDEWLDLWDFWDKRARFLAGARLWETRDQPEELRNTMRWIRAQLPRIDRADGGEFAPRGYVIWAAAGLRTVSQEHEGSHQVSGGPVEPLRGPEQFFASWIEKVPSGFLRAYAIGLVGR